MWDVRSKPMAEHTPGPWRYVSGVIVADIPDGNLMRHNAAIADIMAAWKSSSAMHANGELIAAAPDLLAALQALVTDWSLVPPKDQVPDEINVDAHWEAAIAALDKAKGR